MMKHSGLSHRSLTNTSADKPCCLLHSGHCGPAVCIANMNDVCVYTTGRLSAALLSEHVLMSVHQVSTA